jgi:hypothetical protein
MRTNRNIIIHDCKWEIELKLKKNEQWSQQRFVARSKNGCLRFRGRVTYLSGNGMHVPCILESKI